MSLRAHKVNGKKQVLFFILAMNTEIKQKNLLLTTLKYYGILGLEAKKNSFCNLKTTNANEKIDEGHFKLRSTLCPQVMELPILFHEISSSKQSENIGKNLLR